MMSALDFPLLDPDAARHIDLFITHFVIPTKKRRWRTVLGMKPKKWGGASAYECSVPDDGSLWRVLDGNPGLHPAFADALDRPAWIFPVGHCGGHDPATLSTLRLAICGEDSLSEFVASIVPGKLAVAFGHADEIRLCVR